MHLEVIISIVTPLDYQRQTAQLERARQVQEATAPSQSPRRRPMGTLLRQANAWLRQTIAPLAVPAPRPSTDI